MTVRKMALKSLDIRLRRSKAEPAFAGTTAASKDRRNPTRLTATPIRAE
jgi:hypothetical protein